MYRHLFVPIDGSDLSTQTVAKAVDFARGAGARIAFFTARPDYAATEEGALDRALSPGAFDRHAAGDARALLAQAETVAREAGVEHRSYIRTGNRPYELIVQLSEQLGCDLIFMASHGRRGLQSLIPGSQTQKVLAHTRLPVLVCSVERNVPTRPMDAALGSIEVEHRSLSAVLHGLFSVVRAAHSGQAEPDVKLMRAMLHYIHWMPEALHHPKEEAYLFPLLQQRTHEADEAIAEARRHHANTPVLAAALETGLKAYEADPARGFGEFLKAANELAEAAWLHMSQEEKLILPAAAQHFTVADWAAIRAAFGEDGDPRFAADVEQGYRNLFTRIMNLMPDAEAGGATTGPAGDGTATRA